MAGPARRELEGPSGSEASAPTALGSPAWVPRPDLPLTPAVVLAVQRTAGNASCTALLERRRSVARAAGTSVDPRAAALATQEIQSRDAVVEPHAGGDASGLGALLGGAVEAVGAAVAGLESALGLGEPVSSPRGTAPAAGPLTIGASVGRAGKNDPGDVAAIARALNDAGYGDPGTDIDALATAIARFQADKVKIRPDGRVDPGGRTIKALQAPTASTAPMPATAAAAPAPATPA